MLLNNALLQAKLDKEEEEEMPAMGRQTRARAQPVIVPVTVYKYDPRQAAVPLNARTQVIDHTDISSIL